MPEARRRFDDVADRVDAGAVTLDARQVTLGRPSPVAVHDDGDVGGQPLEVDLTRERFVGRSWRNQARSWSSDIHEPYNRNVARQIVDESLRATFR